jgi:hypothetical protein
MIYWYRLSANAGIIDAQRDLGYSYFYGHGVRQDKVKAVYWYKKAARKNDGKALYNLGLCYEFGDGVTQSLRWAKYYFAKATQYGHQEATKKLKKLTINI